jgi:hypothetical protein
MIIYILGLWVRFHCVYKGEKTAVPWVTGFFKGLRSSGSIPDCFTIRDRAESLASYPHHGVVIPPESSGRQAHLGKQRIVNNPQLQTRLSHILSVYNTSASTPRVRGCMCRGVWDTHVLESQPRAPDHLADGQHDDEAARAGVGLRRRHHERAQRRDPRPPRGTFRGAPMRAVQV